MYYDLTDGLSFVSKLPKNNYDSYEFVFDFKFSLYEEKDIVYNNDGKFNRVRISENIFVNVCKDELNKTMMSILNKKIGTYIKHIESGQKIYIGEDLPGEYTYSRSSQSLTIYKKYIKAIIINNLEDIIKHCYNRDYEPNHKNRHIVDGKYGFYRYKIKFSVKLDKKEEYYEAVVLLRNDANKKKYLYDILGIKKLIE